jgi:RHH-type proline utilization regulon transcriptional repressor/proline dehydrogenase/delta 1-pyrroline-5-carboxylate dehydrogenase
MCPVGEMIPGMAYLVRRLLENTSNEGWLLAANADENASRDQLLAPPAAGRLNRVNGAAGATGIAPDILSEIAAERHELTPAEPGVGDGKPFFNEPMRDLSTERGRELIAAGIAKASIPVVANDRTPEQGLQMVGEAYDAYPAWRDTDPVEKRARVLTEAAAAMRARRDELTGIIIKENGKTWAEADADTCEAIDFCEYYARMAAGSVPPEAAREVHRRARRDLEPAVGRRGGDEPLELPARDLLRDDDGGAGDGQHGRS